MVLHTLNVFHRSVASYSIAAQIRLRPGSYSSVRISESLESPPLNYLDAKHPIERTTEVMRSQNA